MTKDDLGLGEIPEWQRKALEKAIREVMKTADAAARPEDLPHLVRRRMREGAFEDMPPPPERFVETILKDMKKRGQV